MESKQNEFKKAENVKVRVSKNGKWLTHILPEQGIMVVFSMNYYRAIFDQQTEIAAKTLVVNEPSND